MDDRPLTTTLQALIDEEQRRVRSAEYRLGSIIPLAQNAMTILNTAVVSVDTRNAIIAAFLMAIQKSVALAFLSYVRGHTAQAEFNCRQAIEFTCLGAFLLANQDVEYLDVTDHENPIFKPPQAMRVKAFKWFDEVEPLLSGLLKEFKEHINEHTAHGSAYLTSLTIDHNNFDAGGDRFDGSFFDNLSINETRTYLMSFCRLVVLIVETMRRANEASGVIGFKPGLQDEIAECARKVDAYRDALGRIVSASARQPNSARG